MFLTSTKYGKESCLWFADRWLSDYKNLLGDTVRIHVAGMAQLGRMLQGILGFFRQFQKHTSKSRTQTLFLLTPQDGR